MKKLRGLLAAAFLTAALSFAVCQPAFAVSEADVQAKVEASGKESVNNHPHTAQKFVDGYSVSIGVKCKKVE